MRSYFLSWIVFSKIFLVKYIQFGLLEPKLLQKKQCEKHPIIKIRKLLRSCDILFFNYLLDRLKKKLKF